MKKLSIILLVAIILLVCGCATIPQSVPNQYQNYKTFQYPFNTVWSKLILYRSDSQTPVSVIDKDSGIIQTTESATYGFNQWSEQSTKYVVMPSTFLNTWVYAKSNTTYYVQSISDSLTKVTVRINYSLYDSNVYKNWVQTLSSGLREYEILNELDVFLKNN